MEINPKRSEVIKKFLELNTHSDLAALYNENMEVQVFIDKDQGVKIENESYVSYTDGVQTWYNFHIPKKSATEPENNDSPMSFNLDKYAVGIGLSGWDWKNKLSHWVAYDFDAITGHSTKHTNKLTDSELLDLEKSVSNIPWITVRKSTSGSGIHLYVFTKKIETINHKEHEGLARFILGKMAGLTNFDFYSKVDAYGYNFWVWHRKMIKTDGLTLIKKGETLNDISPNWRDHIPVVSGKKSKSIPIFISDNKIEDEFLALTSQKARIPFDEEHKRLINYLNDHKYYCSYDNDHHMIITHTYALKEAHRDLGLKGVFDTIAEGTEQGDLNCFMYPMLNGAWSVRRYTKGIKETPTWEIDTKNWTKCFLNQLPDIKVASRICGGIEHKRAGFVFTKAIDAQQAALMIGTNIELPEWAQNKKAKLNIRKDGKLVMDIEHDPHTDVKLKEFYIEGKYQTGVFETTNSDNSIEPSNYDDIVRHLISINHDDAGWGIKARSNWQSEPINHISKALKNLGHDAFEVEQILGSCVLNSWKLVNIPFQAEYPGNREWNRNAAQLKYIPSPNKDDLFYPTWNKLFEHLGTNLNDALINNKWCKENKITKGSEYLKLWVASLLQHPEEPLPYLFLYSPDQDTGKSSLHEALSLLIINGVKRADTALTSQGSFNGELENAILCAIEETDLRKNKNSLNIIKDWVIAPTVTIHKKGETPYDTINNMHFIQTANDVNFCPIFSGDTRITMILINPLENKIAKRELFRQLDKEAPDFLCEMLSLEIPYYEDRLNIPVINTEVKLQAQSNNKNEVELFIEDHCSEIDGGMTKFSDFYNRFIEWLDPNEIHNWSKIKVGRVVATKYPYGRNFQDGSNFYIGNLSFTKSENGKHRSKIVVKDGKLMSLSEVES